MFGGEIGKNKYGKIDWLETMAYAEELGLPVFDGFLAGHAAKCFNDGMSEEQYCHLLLDDLDNLILNLFLAEQGISRHEHPEKAQARLAVAVVNLKEIELWPWA